MNYNRIISKIERLVGEQDPSRKKIVEETEEIFEFFKKLLSQSQKSGKVVCIKRTDNNNIAIEAKDYFYGSVIVCFSGKRELYLSTFAHGEVENFKKYIIEFAFDNGNKWDMLTAFLEETEKEPERALIEFKSF